MPDTLLTLREAAQLLTVHHETLARWVRRGDLPAYWVGTRMRLRRSDVDEYLGGRIATQPVEGRGPSRQDWSRHRDALYQALLDGRADQSEALVDALLEGGATPSEVYVRSLTPVMRRIGTAWERGIIDVPHEHRATAIVHQVVATLSHRFRTSGTAGTAVTATLTGERHGLGLSMVADFIRSAGWTVHHLGVEVPPDELARFSADVGADIVLLSSHRALDHAVVEELRGATDGCRLIVGGPGLQVEAELPEGVEVVRSPKVLRERLMAATSG